MRDFSYDGAERLKKKRAFTKANRRPIRRTGPNTVERKLWKILGPTFEYTGDGSFKIDNLKPDFINRTRKVVIEVYGNYWHRNEPLSKTMSRVQRFNRYGWRVIIIWENEVHDHSLLHRKLALV